MDALEDNGILIVTTTVGSMEEARALAGRIVESRLAACVQLDAIAESVYRWEGRTCRDPEVRLSIKTVPGAEPHLQRLFDAHHPYELPQFACVRAGAGKAYSDWVRSEVELPLA